MPAVSDDLALHGALHAALKASAALAALVGGRIFDEVPDADILSRSLPFVLIGDSRARNNAAGPGCMPESEIDSEIVVWSRPSEGGALRGSTEAKTIVAAIRAAVGDDAPLVPDGWTVTLQRWLTTSYARQDDGKTFMAIVTVRSRIQPDED